MSWGCGLEVGPHLDQRRPLEQHCIVCVEGVHLVQPAVGHVQFAVLAHQAHHGMAELDINVQRRRMPDNK